jgi:hypothetical protein
MATSILNSVKKMVGVAAEYTAFDLDILTHINTVFSTLNQVGIGPADGFMIEDADATWDAFLGTNPLLNSVKSYVYLRVKLLFDPPPTSYGITAMQEQIREFEWRLNVVREETAWTDPNPVTIPDDGGLDGGNP